MSITVTDTARSSSGVSPTFVPVRCSSTSTSKLAVFSTTELAARLNDTSAPSSSSIVTTWSLGAMICACADTVTVGGDTRFARRSVRSSSPSIRLSSIVSRLTANRSPLTDPGRNVTVCVA